MIIGFLVPHRCEVAAIASCAKCTRRYCQEHLSLSAAGLLCSACAEGRSQPVLSSTTTGFDAADIAAFSVAEAADRGDDHAAFSDLS